MKWVDYCWTRVAIFLFVDGVIVVKMLLLNLSKTSDKTLHISLFATSNELAIDSRVISDPLCFIVLVLSSYEMIGRENVGNSNLV